MPDTSQLPHILKLLDDESPVVRKQLAQELATYGRRLGRELALLPESLDPNQLSLIRDLLAKSHAQWLRDSWRDWFGIENDYERLEASLSLLAQYQAGWMQPVELKVLLDELAEGYRALDAPMEPRALARYLFKTRGFSGNQNDYDHPSNSNLVEVIQTQRGLPISLALIYMLVGYRLGLSIEGCNFPRHFMARVRHQDRILLVDCFHGGRFFDSQEIMDRNPENADHIKAVLGAESPPRTMVARVLNNLTQAYTKASQPDNASLMQDLLKDMFTASEDIHSLVNSTPPKFKTGELVRHVRYGYRGVVVDSDLVCRASHAWYLSNATQPERDQPWYSVLVDSSSTVTYAAQSSLEADPGEELISHPLVPHFFTHFDAGHYVRNDRPWPRQ